MDSGNRECDREVTAAEASHAPLVGDARRRSKPRMLTVAVAIRRQTTEERRNYRAAVCALMAELVSQKLDREKE